MWWTEEIYNVTSLDAKTSKNCTALRSFIQQYLTDRKAGKNKSNLKGNSDLLSLFLSEGDIFTDEFIIDELVDFFLAGMITTSVVLINIISHFNKEHSSVVRVREEVQRQLLEPAYEKDPSLREKTVFEQLN